MQREPQQQHQQAVLLQQDGEPQLLQQVAQPQPVAEEQQQQQCYQCSVCGAQTAQVFVDGGFPPRYNKKPLLFQMGAIMQHMRKVHGVVTRIKCPLCESTYSDQVKFVVLPFP